MKLYISNDNFNSQYCANTPNSPKLLFGVDIVCTAALCMLLLIGRLCLHADLPIGWVL